jgi:hypothetical protein
MAHVHPNLSAAPVAGIAGPHQSTVATILRAVDLGLFTAAQAELLIDRVRAHRTASSVESPVHSPVQPVSVVDGLPATVTAHASGVLADVLTEQSDEYSRAVRPPL